MKRLLPVFLLMVSYHTHAQENKDTKDQVAATNNTLEVTGFSVFDEEVSDSLSIVNDSLVIKEKKSAIEILCCFCLLGFPNLEL